MKIEKYMLEPATNTQRIRIVNGKEIVTGSTGRTKLEWMVGQALIGAFSKLTKMETLEGSEFEDYLIYLASNALRACHEAEKEGAS